MAKAKKHGKASKGVAKKGNKGDNRKRKAKYVDPTSSVSRDVRATAEAIAQEIERASSTEREPAAAPEPSPKRSVEEVIGAAAAGITIKAGMTKKQARKLANQHLQPKPLQNIPDRDEEDDEESSEGGTEEDYSDTANERAKEYRKGGYHPVVIGEIYNDRYRIVRKLGWGYFSTVWLVWDYKEERYQAMKIQKSAKHYSEAAFDEIKLLSEIMQADPHKTRCCARLNDYFSHTGPNGTHVCMVFDVYGENLLSLMERYEYRGIPLPIVKCIARQVLVALEHLTSIDIIHTDLKPENVLLSTPKHAIISLMRHYHPPPLHQRPRLTERDPKTMTKSQRRRYYKKLAKEREMKLEGKNPEDGDSSSEHSDDSAGRENDSEASKTDPEWEVERFHHVVLADFGNSCWTYKQFTDEVQTRQYRCPEVILGEPYSTPIDIWSCACMVFELITGEFLFDPKKGDDYSRDEDHLALMSELLGDLPEGMRLGNGKFRAEYYNSRGELRNIKDLHYWGLEDVLHRKHRFTKKKSKEIADFLLPMLEYTPENRATAAEMLRDFEAFFEIKEDDYEPLCFVERDGEREEVAGSDDNDEEDEQNEEDEESMESYSSGSYSGNEGRLPPAVKTVTAPQNNRSRQLAEGDDEKAEAFRFWEEHPILNRTALEQRGLTITDIQAVLSGKALLTAAAQEAANEVIRLLSEETERLSSDIASDGHDADREDEGEEDGDDDAYDESDGSEQHEEDEEAEEEEEGEEDGAEYTSSDEAATPAANATVSAAAAAAAGSSQPTALEGKS